MTVRLPKRLVCWIPTCHSQAGLILYQQAYGEIIGFCSMHRPVLRVSAEREIPLQEAI